MRGTNTVSYGLDRDDIVNNAVPVQAHCKYQSVRCINITSSLPLTLIMSASSHDISSTDDDDRYTTSNASDDDVPVEDAQTHYQGCESDILDEEEEREGGKLEILLWNHNFRQRDPPEARYVIGISDRV